MWTKEKEEGTRVMEGLVTLSLGFLSGSSVLLCCFLTFGILLFAKDTVYALYGLFVFFKKIELNPSFGVCFGYPSCSFF